MKHSMEWKRNQKKKTNAKKNQAITGKRPTLYRQDKINPRQKAKVTALKTTKKKFLLITHKALCNKATRKQLKR